MLNQSSNSNGVYLIQKFNNSKANFNKQTLMQQLSIRQAKQKIAITNQQYQNSFTILQKRTHYKSAKLTKHIINQQMDIALNPLKRIVKSTLNRDPLQQIFWGTPTADTYLKVLNNYRMLPLQSRQQTIARCMKKLYKPKETQLTIANMALLQKLMKIDFISLPMKEPETIEAGKKKEVTIAEKSFIKFYWQFLKMEEQQIPNKMTNIQEKITFCQLGLNKCLSIINNHIILDYCLSHSPNQVTLRIALKDIFEDCRKDLQVTNVFINTHAKLIYEEATENSFAINEIYQTLIFVSRNINKIAVLIKKAGLSMNLPVYQMNKEMNLRIEMEMNQRKEQKTKFKTEKSIRSRKQIEDHEEMNGYNQEMPPKHKAKSIMQRGFQSLSEIDEDDILIQSEGLL